MSLRGTREDGSLTRESFLGDMHEGVDPRSLARLAAPSVRCSCSWGSLRVGTPAIRERVVSGLMKVAAEFAESVAAGLGTREMPSPMPEVLTREVTPEVSVSRAALVLPGGTRGHQCLACGRADPRIHQGPVPPLQADSRHGRERSPAHGLRDRYGAARRTAGFRCDHDVGREHGERWVHRGHREASALRTRSDPPRV